MVECINDKISLIFDDEKAQIKSLKSDGMEYVFAPMPVFDVSLRDKNGAQVIVSSDEMEPVLCENMSEGFKALYKNNLISVEIAVVVNNCINWGISLSVNDANYVSEWVNYPKITVENDLSPEKDGSKILWGFNEGVIVDDISVREAGYCYVEPGYPSTGVMGLYPAIVETQFMAYFGKDKGLYFAAHDKDDFLKGVDFYRVENGGIYLQFRHYCGCDFGESFSLSYPMVIEFFKGEWEDAAEIYRCWFEENKKSNFVPISENKSLPKWYGESPVVVTYPVRGVHDTDMMKPNKLFPYCNALEHIDRLEKDLGSKIMVLLMHWEGTAPWAPPVVWPPFGGEDELKKFVDAVHERGDVIGVYCSGIGWTLESKLGDYNTHELFERDCLKDEMCLSPEQELPYSKICTGQRVGYDLCPMRQFTKDIVKDQVSKMVGAGLDYIQLLDQNHGGTPYFCYSKNHGHPPVPGKWQVDAMKEILSDVVKSSPGVLFGCESAAAESYIPYLLFSDNRSNLNYYVGRQVPVYSYVYHQYLNNFMGNQVGTHTRFDYHKAQDSLFERIAYSFSAGDMLTLVIDEDGGISWNWGCNNCTIAPDQAAVKMLVKNLNSWRWGYGKKYLHTGKMVKPFEVICGKNEFACNVGGPLVRDRLYTRAWDSDEGDFGQFIINYNAVDDDCKINLPDGRFRIIYNDGGTVEDVSGEYGITIPKLSAVLVEKVGE